LFGEPKRLSIRWEERKLSSSRKAPKSRSKAKPKRTPDSGDSPAEDSALNGDEQGTYEVGYKKPPVETRFKKGKSGNPSGKRKKTAPDLDNFDPGQILQSFDNFPIIAKIDGKRKRLPMAEFHFLQQFDKSIEGNMTAARLIKDLAAKYFGPDAEGPSETRFLVMPDAYFDNPGTFKGEGRYLPTTSSGASQQEVSTGHLFRKVAKSLIQSEFNGVKFMTSRWRAYVFQLYKMALNDDNRAARLLIQLHNQFPGDALPGDPTDLISTEADARL
jgi:hypothetical protein